MEYELYLYCTGMGTLIIMLILLYHCLGNDTKIEQDGSVEPASPKKVWLFDLCIIYLGSAFIIG